LGAPLAGLVHASIDISDGLAADLGHVIHTSSVGAEIQLSEVPLSNAAKAVLELQKADIADLISGGDDYELLLTAPPEHRQALADIAVKTGILLTRIGQITATNEVVFLDKAHRRVSIKRTGYKHF
jgi:thiamine-monophosphate kinase